jgi:hypothetical protein
MSPATTGQLFSNNAAHWTLFNDQRLVTTDAWTVDNIREAG